MSSSQALGAGDGPSSSSLLDTKGSTSGPSSPWTNLPLSMYKLLGPKLDTEGYCNMRLVCTEWRKNVEQCIGLKVKVDNSIEGNLDFVRRVKVADARVVNWTVDIGTDPANHLFQHPDWIKKLKLSGKMPVTWKIHDLSLFPNLAHLVLRDTALHSNNFTGRPLPVLNFDLTSELTLEQLLTNAFESHDPPSEAQPIELKSLETLEIVNYGYWNYRRYVQVQIHGYLVMATNVSFILNHVKSPLLTVALLTVNLPMEIHKSVKLNWTLDPLHRFLANHRTSLRQLLLPNTFGQASYLLQHEDLSDSFPINLRKLMLDVHEEWRDHNNPPEPVQSDFVYLQNCLQRQTQLQEVHFNFSRFPVKWISDAFNSLANSCNSTLRYLELQGMPDGIAGGSLDLQMLSACHNLEVLHMPWWLQSHVNMTITNMELLPTSLKRLLICMGTEGHIEIGDPDVFKRLKVLEWLHLNGIRVTATNLTNPQPQRPVLGTMIKGLLGLRSLQGFSLVVRELAFNRDLSSVRMLSPLDPRINPALRNQQNKCSYNLNWQYYHEHGPWSDNPFDLDTWEMEKTMDDADVRRQRQQAMQLNIARGPVVAMPFEDDEDEDMDSDDEDDF